MQLIKTTYKLDKYTVAATLRQQNNININRFNNKKAVVEITTIISVKNKQHNLVKNNYSNKTYSNIKTTATTNNFNCNNPNNTDSINN